MTMATVVSIARDYSPSPAGRTPADGPFNGERFRDSVLLPALQQAAKKNDKVVVDLDDAHSYSSSFLEEVFGGIVRKHVFEAAQLANLLEIRVNNPIYESFKRDAAKYFNDALKAQR
jgi:hypothetical protein